MLSLSLYLCINVVDASVAMCPVKSWGGFVSLGSLCFI